MTRRLLAAVLASLLGATLATACGSTTGAARPPVATTTRWQACVDAVDAIRYPHGIHVDTARTLEVLRERTTSEFASMSSLLGAASSLSASAHARGLAVPPAYRRDLAAASSRCAALFRAADGRPGPPARRAPPASRPLLGRTVLLDPGHDGHNYLDPTYVNRLIWNGRETETCDTTGTATDSGYTEALFNFQVAELAARDLRALGAHVVLTRTTNDGVGPCVTARTALGNRLHAAVAISIHADGGPPDGRGFAILTPVADGINDRIVEPSTRFAEDLRSSLLAHTPMPVSTYDGVDGIQPRDDLAGTNLSTVPKVFLECGNMRNATDAALLETPSFRAEMATAITDAMVVFLTGREPPAAPRDVTTAH